jgi:hypothetical protein
MKESTPATEVFATSELAKMDDRNGQLGTVPIAMIAEWLDRS